VAERVFHRLRNRLSNHCKKMLQTTALVRHCLLSFSAAQRRHLRSRFRRI
jgi:hypothetical protein